MLNYLKSELYRITHTKELYLFTGILCALAFLLNCCLRFWGSHYAITSFSYSNLVSNPMFFTITGVVLAYILYEDSQKNGNLKNTVASGISRIKIFAGECIISLAAATFSMVVILAVWILSAETLLPQSGPVLYQDLLWEAMMTWLISIAGLISGLAFLALFEKSMLRILAWFLIWFGIPKAFIYLALRFEAFYPAAMWMPDNFFAVNETNVNMGRCITIWDTTGGMAQCMISGLIGIIIFAAVGILAVRKKDL